MSEQVELNKMNGLSLDLAKVNLEKLKAIFPDCVSKESNGGGYRVDFNKILSLCGLENDYDEDLEKYSFTWKGKAQSLRTAQRQSSATLRPCEDESVNFENTQNLYIEGDNLEVLKLMQKSYFGKIKMIYIDPPYNTGNDFIYEDDFKEPLERYKEITSQTTKSNPETMGRFHTNWLNMMYPRLRLAANLLSEDGVIFISIDDMEQANLKKICDEVFGEENFKSNSIIINNRGGRDYGGIALQHDYVLIYTKSSNSSIKLLEEKNKKFKFYDEVGGFNLMELRNRNVKFNDQNRPNLYYPFYVNPNKKDSNGLMGLSLEPKEGFIEVYPAKSNGIQTVWRWGKEEKARKNLNIELFGKENKNGGYMIVQKYRKTEKMQRSIWNDKTFVNERGTEALKELFGKSYFEYPKSPFTIKRVIELGSDPDSIILDFFSGSATTADAVMQLNAEDGGNRKFILVQIPALCDEKTEAFKAGYKNLCQIGKERIRRAGKLINDKLASEGKDPIDVGFKVLKLDSSNIVTWDNSLIENNDLNKLKDRMSKQIKGLKEDRNSLDLIYEILLKMGYQLTSQIEEIALDNITIFSVENNELLICLAQGVTPNEVEKMLDLKPQKIVISESSFVDNSTLSNAFYFCKNQNVELKLI